MRTRSFRTFQKILRARERVNARTARTERINAVFVSLERMFVETHSDPNSGCPCVRPLKFRLTFFKLLQVVQIVRFNYNQTWIIGALWEPSHYDALGGHMTRSKVI